MAVGIQSSSENFAATCAHHLTAVANICAGKVIK